MTKVKKYKWDVAISLTKQDVDFARKLVEAINPNIKVFFYENRQEELIGKSGPETFAKIFREQSRIVVVLSREEWAKSYYTDIERNAIIDRTAIKDEGYQFLMIIPMVHNEIPNWYPSTRIYADPHRFTIDELAKFIEFKVVENGGEIKPRTAEDLYQNLLRRIEEKKSVIKLQIEKKAIESAYNEIKIFKKNFNNKIKSLTKEIVFSTTHSLFDENSEFFVEEEEAYLKFENYELYCKISLNDRIVSTQNFNILFSISRNDENVELEERVFYYTEQNKGWALRQIITNVSGIDTAILFRNIRNQYYDLKDPIHTQDLVDYWFQKLLSILIQSLEPFLLRKIEYK